MPRFSRALVGVALAAVIPQLLLQLNAVARRGSPWQPDYQPVA